MHTALTVTYRVRTEPQVIAARAQAIAIEQSVETPVDAINDEGVKADILGRVIDIADAGDGTFAVKIALSAETMKCDAGQLLNMLFGNTSLHNDVVLDDVEFPADFISSFGGPGFGLLGLRHRAEAKSRALTATALKPQGLSATKLAHLACRFAEGGIDYVKDDHGLADQSYSPFAERVETIACALRGMGTKTRYVPSLSGDLDALRGQLAIARDLGLDTVMIAPMIIGVANLQRLVRESPDIAFLAHPALAGSHMSPPLLFGKIFRMLGADAIIYPNYGGRFGYSKETCRQVARTALDIRNGLRSCAPVPAGGMTTARVHEMLEFYGVDIMLLIGGNLLAAGERLLAETKAFVAAVHDYR